MSSEEKLLIDEEEFIQINNLNRVGDIQKTDLMLLDDGGSNCNAITYENFLKKTKDKIFKNEGLEYFKEVIKDTIATELLANENFINQAYNKVLEKLLNNANNGVYNISDKVRDRIIGNISSTTLTKNDKFVIMNYSTLQKSPVPEYLTGIPSGFTTTKSKTTSSYIYPSYFKNQAYVLDMTSEYSNQEVELLFYTSDDDNPIYLDITVALTINASGTKYAKKVALKYTDSSQKSTAYYYGAMNAYVDILCPVLRGWYIQKRGYINGNRVPVLVKL
ncbi:Putative cytosolic protein (plasmid) [Borrelia nietonii YOR]|uniref:Putative cytosolic protein n=1 Tax=Borrelia nietonii YOR TaxID=1293576 RepID=W5SAB7_9SPIR|nr:DUF685 domain-containing protein [Borrelia nietonii]AHH03885.1 Putative cytosolic protein [Borrelia nietonii YOR]